MKSPRPRTIPSVYACPRAFTLVEMLVVIGIVGVLAAITVPAVGKVRESASSTSATNSLRQLGLSMATVMADNNNNLPVGWKSGLPYPNWYNRLTHAEFGTSISISTWVDVFQNKLATAKEDFQATSGANLPRIYSTPYGLNVFLSRAASGLLSADAGSWNMLRLPKPSSTVIVGDGFVMPYGSAGAQLDPAKQPGTSESISYRHPGGKASLLFGDWHVALATRPEVLAHPEWFDPTK